MLWQVEHGFSYHEWARMCIPPLLRIPEKLHHFLAAGGTGAFLMAAGASFGLDDCSYGQVSEEK